MNTGSHSQRRLDTRETLEREAVFPRSYQGKYAKSTADSGLELEEDLLAFLESLNQRDFIEFLEDLLWYRPSGLYEIMMPPRGEDILSYTALFLKKLGKHAFHLVGEALDQVLNNYLAEADKEGSAGMAMNALTLAIVLRSAVSTDALTSIVAKRSIPAKVRKHAAAALLGYEDRGMFRFWLNLDVKSDPILVPKVILALSKSAPRKALETLLRVEDIPEEAGSLQVPLRSTIRELLSTRNGLSVLQSVRDSLSGRARKSIEDVLKLEEFQDLISLGSPIEVSVVDRWVAQLAIELVFWYVYSGYLEGKLFERTDYIDQIPSPFRRMAKNFALELKRITGISGKIKVRPRHYGGISRLVAAVVSHEIFLAEPAYGTRERLESSGILQVGILRHFGMVLPSNLVRIFLDEFTEEDHPLQDPRVLMNIPQMEFGDEVYSFEDLSIGRPSDVFGYCMINKIRCVHQSSTAISEELAGIFDEMDRNRKTRSGENLPEPPEEKYKAVIDDLGDIETVMQKNPSMVVFLDWITAKKLVKSSRMSEQELYLLIGTYDNPLKVGYFYPPRDTEFMNLLLKVMYESLMTKTEKKRWRADFRQWMKGCLVELGPDIEVVPGNGDLEVITSHLTPPRP